MNIQWFPGHMTRAIRELREQLKLISCVIMTCDARVPISARNPMLAEIASNKPILSVFTKTDLADAQETEKWVRHLKQQGDNACFVNCKSSCKATILAGLDRVLEQKRNHDKARGLVGKTYRIAIVGIPNSGKSTLINLLCKKKSAKTGDKPGVTKGQQWLSIGRSYELLDTPGILWHRFENEQCGEHLALTGAIPNDVVDCTALAVVLIERLRTLGYEHLLHERYDLAPSSLSPAELLSQIALKRGAVGNGGQPLLDKISLIILDEFRGGKIGRISLERVGDEELC